MATGAVTEEIATNLEEVAEVTRRINTQSVGSLFVGIGIGSAVGFFFGYRYSKKKLRYEIMLEAEDEITKMKEYYRQKVVAAQEKPKAEEIIKERGYRTRQDETEALLFPEQDERLRPPVPMMERPISPEPETEKNPDENWAHASELSRRTSLAPYVIHQEEFNSSDTSYAKVTFTYYDDDDVLVDEDEKPLPHPDVVVGQKNLRFGHGSSDPDVVYVRNDKLQLEMEICRVKRSYEEEVLGLESNDSN